MNSPFLRIRPRPVFLSLVLALHACAGPGRAPTQDAVASDDERPVTEVADGDQVAESEHQASYPSLDLGYRGAGISFGNSRNWRGLRINARDHGVEHIQGVNLTLWSPLSPAVERLDGVALGIAPVAAETNGIAVGLLATVSEKSMVGLQLGGLAAVSAGTQDGIALGGLALVADDSMEGIGVGGLAVVTTSSLSGVHAAGLAVVSGGATTGINVAGLAVVNEAGRMGQVLGELSDGPARPAAEPSMRGVNIAGLAVITGGQMEGISLAGLATVAEGGLRGIGVSGLATQFGDELNGIGIGGLAVASGDLKFRNLLPDGAPDGDRHSRASGIMLAGYRVQANSISGLAVAGLVTRSHDMNGLAVAAYNGVSGRQTGMSIGLFNYASELRGIQIGLLNHVGDNPKWLRWLPLINMRF
ncbi:MAG: hypothetical protein ACI8QZ_003643 [Chlamydiales bacterium]|jgi:hypothetical protein